MWSMDDEPVTKIEVIASKGFPTVAIVVISVGAYLFLFFILILIRKICLSKGYDCPSWCGEVCVSPADNINTDPSKCALLFATHCDCPYPNKRVCMDTMCPSRDWCNNTFCWCLARDPNSGRNSICCGVGSNSGRSFGCCDDLNDINLDCTDLKSFNCCFMEIKLNGGGATGPSHLSGSRVSIGYNNQGYGDNNAVQQQPGVLPANFNQHQSVIGQPPPPPNYDHQNSVQIIQKQ